MSESLLRGSTWCGPTGYREVNQVPTSTSTSRPVSTGNRCGPMRYFSLVLPLTDITGIAAIADGDRQSASTGVATGG